MTCNHASIFRSPLDAFNTALYEMVKGYRQPEHPLRNHLESKEKYGNCAETAALREIDDALDNAYRRLARHKLYTNSHSGAFAAHGPVDCLHLVARHRALRNAVKSLIDKKAAILVRVGSGMPVIFMKRALYCYFHPHEKGHATADNIECHHQYACPHPRMLRPIPWFVPNDSLPTYPPMKRVRLK